MSSNNNHGGGATREWETDDRQPETAADAAPAKKRRRSPWLSALQIATHGPDRYFEARNRTSSEESRIKCTVALISRRVHELGGQLSLLNPLWYGGSLVMGALAGVLGDKWNLGFLAETERQVGQHLQHHLQRLPQQDEKSRAIVTQMYQDETGHAAKAVALGGAELPQVVQWAMRLNSKVMTGTSYWV